MYKRGQCVDMCIGMCADMCADMCVEMCVDMCMGMCAGMRIAMCACNDVTLVDYAKVQSLFLVRLLLGSIPIYTPSTPYIPL